MEFDLVSKKCKNIVKTVSGAELCLDIPGWLLMEVLIRLPVKLVFRCKLVCKPWLSVISDTCFAELPPTWTFVYSDMYVEGEPKYELLEDIYSQNLKCPSLYSFRCPFMTYSSMKEYKIVAVSNDLVVYRPSKKVGDHYIYNICNPITRQWISLPPYAHCPEFENIGFVTHVEDGLLSSYRIVRLEVPFEKTNIIRFLVFISETNEWKEFDVYTERELLGRGITVHHPAMLNGILHWITDRNWIMAYDPYRKPDSLRFIALPRDIDPESNENIGIRTFLGAHQGHLRYVESSGRHKRGFSSIGVWTINNYDSGDWCMQHRISSDDIIYDDVLPSFDLFLEPIFFHPFDPDIVYFGLNHIYVSYIISYNIKTRKLESHRGVFRSRDYIFWWWTFLFVIPPWPTSIVPSSSGVIV